MGLFSRLFGRRDPEPGPGPAWRAEGAVRRERGEHGLANRFDRAADAPQDPEAAFDLGSELLSCGEADGAVPVLAHALQLAPFDAILRSELALAQAHAGRPHDALETLALHPCLADDPGALYWLGWCALATGDLGLSHRAVEDLEPHRAAGRLRALLGDAVARAEALPYDPSDARDRYFVETGGVLLGSDDVAAVAGAVGLLGLSPDVVAADEAARPLAEALAAATGGALLPLPAQGRLPRGTLVALDVDAVHAARDRLGTPGEVVCYVPTHDVARGATLAPDFVGTLRGARPPHGALDAFLDAHRALLPREDRGPYVPDLPREEKPR